MTTAENRKELQSALASWEDGDIDAAWNIAYKVLTDEPNEPSALCLAGLVFERKNNWPVAYQLFKRVVELMPKEPRAWLHMGRISGHLWQTQESERAYNRCLSLNPPDASKAQAYGNLSAIRLDHGRWQEAEVFAKKALEIDPKTRTANANLGFSQFAQANWAEGWKNYHCTIGTDWRPMTRYGNEPEWDGTSGQRVAIYGEQGLGDEICFASMVNDAIKVCDKVVLDVDARLQGLFKRSFPKASVYGTRTASSDSGIKWAKDDRRIDASLAMGQLGEYFRTDAAQFTETRFLTPCPVRSAQWKSLFECKHKPVIGIAWSGGTAKTGAKFRHAALDEWLPVFESIDAHFVCLQYKDAEEEIAAFRVKHKIDLVQYPWATLTKDYDDTAALVSALDAVISVPTTVVHLSGGLGVRTMAVKSNPSCWKFASGLPFHPTVTLIENQGDWYNTLKLAAKMLVPTLFAPEELAA